MASCIQCQECSEAPSLLSAVQSASAGLGTTTAHRRELSAYVSTSSFTPTLPVPGKPRADFVRPYQLQLAIVAVFLSEISRYAGRLSKQTSSRAQGDKLIRERKVEKVDEFSLKRK